MERCNEILRGFSPHCPIRAPALAQHQTFAINPDASQVEMTLNTTHELVHGTFHSSPEQLSLTAQSYHVGFGGCARRQRQDRQWQSRQEDEP